LKQVLDTDSANSCQSRQDLLDAILLSKIEPQLGKDTWCFLYDYPADQAAQARLHQDQFGNHCAARFELYWNGIELANGYEENTDSASIRAAFTKDNENNLPLDEKYLYALEQGLCDCSGVAVGLDRIFMLCNNITDISESLSFPWSDI
ncbi:MAG: hypothetical protein HRU15_11545, partial [Planctomycetes bacterium]|nr:hypothetical protein [Planctomycetota bacterium]